MCHGPGVCFDVFMRVKTPTATLVPLARGISATLLPVKGIEKPVSAETLERGLATALAPLLPAQAQLLEDLQILRSALEAAGVKTVRNPAELGKAIAEVTGWK